MFRDSEFYQDPACFFVILSMLNFHFNYGGWHAFLIPHALQRGLSLQHTIVITLCASVGNVIGRLMAGYLTQRLVKPIDLFLSIGIVNVGLLLWYAFTRSFIAMLILSVLSAWSILGRAVLPILIFRERASPDNFPTMLAVNDTVGGLGQLMGAYLSGN